MNDILTEKFDKHNDVSLKLLELLPKTDDLTLITLKGHLIVEEALNTLVKSHCNYPGYIIKARLSFAQLSSLSKALISMPIHEQVFPVIDKLNKLRNNLAHNITSNKADQLAKELVGIIKIEGADHLKHELSIAAQVRLVIVYILSQLSMLAAVSEFLLTSDISKKENA